MAQRTLIAIVLDRSGSMQALRDDAIGGFNALVEEQKGLPGEARLLLAQFDHEYEIVFDGVPLAAVPELTRTSFVPRGQTALLDAVGRTLNDIEARIERLIPAERPQRVVCAIITDGQENASVEFNHQAVREMIDVHRRLHGWEVIFLGTSEIAVETSRQWGVPGSHTTMFRATGCGTTEAFRAVSECVRRCRAGAHAAISSEARKKMN